MSFFLEWNTHTHTHRLREYRSAAFDVLIPSISSYRRAWIETSDNTTCGIPEKIPSPCSSSGVTPNTSMRAFEVNLPPPTHPPLPIAGCGCSLHQTTKSFFTLFFAKLAHRYIYFFTCTNLTNKYGVITQWLSLADSFNNVQYLIGPEESRKCASFTTWGCSRGQWVVSGRALGSLQPCRCLDTEVWPDPGVIRVIHVLVPGLF